MAAWNTREAAASAIRRSWAGPSPAAHCPVESAASTADVVAEIASIFTTLVKTETTSLMASPSRGRPRRLPLAGFVGRTPGRPSAASPRRCASPAGGAPGRHTRLPWEKARTPAPAQAVDESGQSATCYTADDSGCCIASAPRPTSAVGTGARAAKALLLRESPEPGLIIIVPRLHRSASRDEL